MGLMLLLASCGGSDTAAPPGSPVPATGTPVASTGSFGGNGAPAFRLVSNGSAFDLREGNAITIPVGID